MVPQHVAGCDTPPSWGSNSPRSGQSSLHRLDLLHVGLEERVSPNAVMDDERVPRLLLLRARAAKFEELRLANARNGPVSCNAAADRAPWLVDVAMHPLTGRKKTFGLVGRQSEVGIRHGNSPAIVCPRSKQTYIQSEGIIRPVSILWLIPSRVVVHKATASLSLQCEEAARRPTTPTRVLSARD